MKADALAELCPDLPDEVVPFAWRNLCARLVLEAALSIERSRKRIKNQRGSEKYQPVSESEALEWVAGGPAVIPYAEACECLGCCGDRLRERMLERAERLKRRPYVGLERPLRLREIR